MRWTLDDPSGTFEISLDGSPPTRDEIDALLQELALLVGERGVRVMLIDGQRVSGGALTYPEIVGLVRYQAARWRSERGSDALGARP